MKEDMQSYPNTGFFQWRCVHVHVFAAFRVALLHFNFSAEHGFALTLWLLRDRLLQMVEVEGCGIAAQAAKAGRCSCYELFNQAD